MSLLQSYLYYIFMCFFMELSLFFVILSFLDYPILPRKLLLLALAGDFIGSLPVFALTMQSNGKLWVLCFAENISLFINLILVCKALEKDKKKAILASCFGYACYYQIYAGSFCIASVAGSIVSILACAILCYGAGKLLRNLRVSDCIDYFLKEKRQQKYLLILSLLLCESWYGYQMLSEWLSGFVELFAYQTWLFAALFFLMLLYITFYARHKQKEEAQETLLMQQQMYIESLEELERDVRMYRHDYKNILSGLMLSAKEGDLLKIQEFLQNSAGNFEEAVGKKIQQTTQIANLRQTELKSLVLMKLIQMQKLGVSCHFEALYPIESISMNPLDLNRCVGILIDNAIEETMQQKNGRINLIFSRQNEILTILVENTIEHDMSIPSLFQEGYSTKGAKRGNGLSSYMQILRKYKNAASMTSIKDQMLIQELKISCASH